MSRNISANTNSTIDTLFQDDEKEIEIHNLFLDLDKIPELFESSNTDEGILPKINRQIPTIFCNSYTENKKTIILPKNKENMLNKERKNILKTYKIERQKKIKVKVGKQNYDNNTRIKGNNHQNSIYEFPKNYNEFDGVNELKSYDDIKFDKNGIQTFTEESQKSILTQKVDNPDLSWENSITNEIVISPFNYEIFNENGNKDKSNKFDEPLFISFEYILKHYKKYIEKLWSKENQIFKDENDLKNTLKNGKIYQNVFIYLSKDNWNKAEKRKFDADGMIKKIKTQLLESIRNYINSFDVMKYCEIYKLKKDLINDRIKANFNLIYLTQELYNILSNDSSNKNHNSNKDKILEIKNQNFSFFKKHFCLTIQKCLDIFRYKEQNLRFKNKLVEFLIKQYIEFKGDNQYKKDYIASLILLTYNFERFFYLRLPKYLKNKAK